MPSRRCRARAAAALLLMLAGCSRGGFGRQYEYDEQLYLNADGSASVVVNASLPALVALRGLTFDVSSRARVDREAVRDAVSEPGLEITRVSRPWRRDGRQFIQIRAEIDDVRRLGETKLFGWSTYTLSQNPDGTRDFRQVVEAPAASESAGVPAGAGWNGGEIVAFKLHLPSRIYSHNVRVLETNETGAVERGNILTWEQRLRDRLAGTPLDMQVSMESGSILYRTLWLFAASFAAAILLLAFIVWRIIRRGKQVRL